MNEYTRSSRWPVLDSDGAHVGDIIRQPGSTLWSLQRKGMDRPFKRNIRSLEAAQSLAAAHPQVWGGANFNLSQSLIHTGIWLGTFGLLFLIWR